MDKITKEMVIEKLKSVKDKNSGKNVVELGYIKGLIVKDKKIAFAIEVPHNDPALQEEIRKDCETAAKKLSGIKKVSAVMTAHSSAQSHSHSTTSNGNATNSHTRPKQEQKANQTADIRELIPAIKQIIAVSSGKGGVGKSTIAVNLAIALSKLSKKVGILDADIYGPSLPHMLGYDKKPEVIGNKLKPVSAHGITCMSMGYLIEEDQPVIWRGPMVLGALEQLLREVHWGELDILVVDMPPGTGDIQLTMAQRAAMDGAIVVSTPQDIALIDAKKGLNMFKKVNVPVLGFVENMSYYLCPHCGERSDIFGHGGAKKAASKMDVNFLGEIPLNGEIRENSDKGLPIIAIKPDSIESEAFMELARNTLKAMDTEKAKAKAAPKINIT